MENLLVLLDKVQQISPLPVLSQDTIIVQNAGMQHWLNLSLAQQRGISMNVKYALPAQFLWQLIRSLASDENVPEQSPYSREVLAWRICHLLASPDVCEDSDFIEANQYWQSERNEEAAQLKRYQLACQLADLYEQYLIFRPQWIDAWHKGDFSTFFDNGDSAEISVEVNLARWQGKLWQMLTKEQAYNPLTLIDQAITNLSDANSDKASLLPKRLSFFGINVMAPMWLSFIHQLSKYTEVHFFHLNPCYAYWGDILSEKQAIKSITDWVNGHDDISQSVGNPLLGNLGQQGREFMALLHEFSTINIEVFESVIDENTEHSPTILERVQHDILTLTDARISPQNGQDDSIIVTSCHSALREVQGLHDWLLHQFNDDPTLTPKDVLVMCPQVEHYAPYVNAVFTRSWQELDDNLPPLPCSIADRVSKDAEPVVAAFSDLLSLPESRFQVSQLVALLRLPAMQERFELSSEDIDKISVWLSQASIHWGLDKDHKKQILNSTIATESYTWQQGLARLIKGFAYGDQAVIYREQLLLPSVEGNDGELLGKLMLIIEQLQNDAIQLASARNATQWQAYLQNMIGQLFDTEQDNGFTIINQAIESLVEYCSHANYLDNIPLAIVRDFLNQHFSQPDPGRQFMVGQVTFCSMLPMRSIPFRVIAVLGLNDGEFPRQRQPLGFDLMTHSPTKLGDRSRRGDDRYLFLEAIISARQSLYLSYQGKNIKNNADKQASLVLKELMEYLQLGYGWQLTSDKPEDNIHLRQLAMQAYSKANYQGQYLSFDKNWLALAQQADEHSLIVDQPLHIEPENIKGEKTKVALSLPQLVSFFQHPSKVFAKAQLDLHFEDYATELEDIEPFSVDRLESYLMRQELLAQYLSHQESDDEIKEQAISHCLHAAKLSGKFPDNPMISETFEQWREDSEVFSNILAEQGATQPQTLDASMTISIDLADFNEQLGSAMSGAVTIELSAQLSIHQEQIVLYRSSTAKSKDFLQLYFNQLFIQVWQQENGVLTDNDSVQEKLHQLKSTHGYYFDTKRQKVIQFYYQNIPDARQRLSLMLATYLLGHQQPLLVNAELGEYTCKDQPFEQQDLENLWHDDNAAFSLGDDPYMHYFWQKCPTLEEHETPLKALYSTMVSARGQVK